MPVRLHALFCGCAENEGTTASRTASRPGRPHLRRRRLHDQARATRPDVDVSSKSARALDHSLGYRCPTLAGLLKPAYAGMPALHRPCGMPSCILETPPNSHAGQVVCVCLLRGFRQTEQESEATDAPASSSPCVRPSRSGSVWTLAYVPPDRPRYSESGLTKCPNAMPGNTDKLEYSRSIPA